MAFYVRSTVTILMEALFSRQLIFLLFLSLFGNFSLVWAGFFPGVETWPEAEDDWHLVQIRVYEAQVLSCGEGVVVVDIDSGVNASHPDLRSHLWLEPAYDFADNDTDVRDTIGHGTATAGIIAQIAPCARILPLKISPDGFSVFDSPPLIEALRYVLEMLPRHPEIKVINLSLTVGSYEEEVARLLREIMARGVSVVAAAGNEGYPEVDFPASLPGVIAVSSSDIMDKLAPDANYGPGLLVIAPGENIKVPALAGGYTYMSGTSMATAVVSGVMALLRSFDSSDYLFDLAEGSVDISWPGYDEKTGFGRVSALNSLIASLKKSLPILPERIYLTPGEERKIFFPPIETVRVILPDNELIRLEELNPREGYLKIKARGLGQTELYIYKTDPLQANRVKISISRETVNALEAFAYPFSGSQVPEYLCYYITVLDELQTFSFLRLFHFDQNEKYYLTTYAGSLSPQLLYGCKALEDFVEYLPPGLYEILLCGEYFECQRHVFIIY